jgi:hypothetical protein
MHSINEMANPSNEVQTNTEPSNTPSELVQNYLDIFRGATPQCLRGSIQEREEEAERDIMMQKVLWRKPKLESSRGGLGAALDNTAEKLDAQIKENRAIAVAMRGLLRHTEAERGSRKKLARQKRRQALARKEQKELIVQAQKGSEGPAGE